MRNLSEEIRKNKSISWFERLKTYWHPDLYFADSIADIKEHLKHHTPRKKEGGFPTANIRLDHTEIAPYPHTLPDRCTDIDLGDSPAFMLRDSSGMMVVKWGAGSSEDYTHAVSAFRLREGVYVRISHIYLQSYKVESPYCVLRRLRN